MLGRGLPALLACAAAGRARCRRPQQPRFHPAATRRPGARCGDVARAARPARARGPDDPDRLRALPAARPRPPGARHDGRTSRAGRATRRRTAAPTSSSCRAADGPARPAARRRPRHRAAPARSTARRCAGPSPDYIRRAGRCAAQLGPRVDRYNTRAATDDLADVLDALGIRRRSTSTATPTAPTSGRRSRSTTRTGCARSSSTAPIRCPGTDPSFGDLAEATWRALALVCARRPSCAARGRGPARGPGAVRRAASARGRCAARAPTPRAAASACGSTRRRSSRSSSRLRQPPDVPRPARRDPRVRGGRPRADAAARGRDDARAGGLARAQLLRGASTSP